MSDSSSSLHRRDFLRAGAVAAAATALDVTVGQAHPPAVRSAEPPSLQQSAFELEESTVAALQDGLRSG